MSPRYAFEWDPRKAQENLKKHGLSFEQAASVFQDPLAMSIFDDEHSSAGEDRWITLGSVGSELVVVIHTFTEVPPDGAVIRVISARRATKREQLQYEEGQ